MNLAAMKRAYSLRHKVDYNDFRYGKLEEELEDVTWKFVKDFWTYKNKEFLESHKANFQDPEITPQAAVFKLRKEIRKLAHANNLGCTFLSKAGQYFISLLPCQIHIAIARESGCFTISLPHFNRKQFFYYEWQTGLQWIQDYLNIDLYILEEKKQELKRMILLSSKTAEIAIASIRSICKIHAEKLGVKTRIRYSWLNSEIEIGMFDIVIFHKTFIDNPSLLTDLLENPHDMEIENTIRCTLN